MRLIYLYLVLLMSVHVVSSRMPEGLLSHVPYTYISLRHSRRWKQMEKEQLLFQSKIRVNASSFSSFTFTLIFFALTFRSQVRSGRSKEMKVDFANVRKWMLRRQRTVHLKVDGHLYPSDRLLTIMDGPMQAVFGKSGRSNR